MVSCLVLRASCLATLMISITDIGRNFPFVLKELNSPSVVNPAINEARFHSSVSRSEINNIVCDRHYVKYKHFVKIQW